jgi:hypothetical protein
VTAAPRGRIDIVLAAGPDGQDDDRAEHSKQARTHGELLENQTVY